MIAFATFSQLLLPRLAANRVRGQFASHGHVATVRVSAFPAIKLLWGRADSVSLHMKDLETSSGQSGELLAHANATARLQLFIDRLSVGSLTLNSAHAVKRGSQLTGTASLSQSALRAAIPAGFDLQPLPSGGGELLLRASASLFGVGVSANAAVQAQDGALVLQPVGIPFGGLVKLTVFSDPHLFVERIAAQPAAGGYNLTVTGRLR